MYTGIGGSVPATILACSIKRYLSSEGGSLNTPMHPAVHQEVLWCIKIDGKLSRSMSITFLSKFLLITATCMMLPRVLSCPTSVDPTTMVATEGIREGIITVLVP